MLLMAAIIIAGSIVISVLFGRNMPVCMSNTNTDATCLKLVFAKFACSIKSAGKPYLHHKN